MPSFRVVMTIGALRPGVAPQRILPIAADAARELTAVEASDLAVVAGEARITVRFEAEDAELAVQIGEHVADVTSRSAQVLAARITERVRGAWLAR